MRFAFLSDGKLFLKSDDGAPRPLESAFAADRAERERERAERHAWKGAGRDPQETFNARAVWGRQSASDSLDDGAPVYRHIAAGARPGELLYVLEMSASSGLFRHDVETGEEQRVFHRQEFLCGGLSCHPRSGEIVYSAADKSGLANLERFAAERSRDRSLTDGEARDAHPAHDPRKPGAVVFQSAGAGRDGEGRLLAFGPAAVLRFDPDARELETLAEGDYHDHLAPRLDRQGNLYFIRRPYQDFARPGVMAQIKGFVLMPYHLGRALFGFMDAFTRLFARTPLRPAGGPETKRPTARRWVQVHETAIELEQSLRRHERGDDNASLVPATWELVRRAPDGHEETLARNVACFTVGPDDSLLYTNGFTVWHRPPDTTAARVVHRGKVIQALAFA